MSVSTDAQADCIGRRDDSPSDRLALADLVFVADILKVEPVIREPEPFRYRVRVRVRQAFKGTERGERTFEFQPSVEDVKLQEGQLMLVYAYRRQSNGTFTTACSPTRTVALDDPELEALRRASAAP